MIDQLLERLNLTNEQHNILYLVIFLFIVAILLIILIPIFTKNTKNKFKNNIDQLNNELANVKAQNDSLLIDISRIQSDNKDINIQNAILVEDNKKKNEIIESFNNIIITKDQLINNLNIQIQDLSKSEISLKKDLEAKEQQSKNEQQHFEQQQRILEANINNIVNNLIKDQTKDLTEQSNKHIGNLIKQFQEETNEFKKFSRQQHEKNIEHNTIITNKINDLTSTNKEFIKETSDLSKALRGNKKVLGQWGENQLQLLLESSGLRLNIDFYKEYTIGKQRFDFVINLPNNAHLILDAKTSLVNYYEAIKTTDPEEKTNYIKKLVEDMRNHVKTLSSKEYHNAIKNSPEFVVMFVPIEAALVTALQNSPELHNEALASKVVIAGVSTISPILNLVNNLWSHNNLTDEAQKLIESANKIYELIYKILNKTLKLGKSITSTTQSYNDLVTGLVGRQGITSEIDKYKRLSAEIVEELELSKIDNVQIIKKTNDLIERIDSMDEQPIKRDLLIESNKDIKVTDIKNNIEDKNIQNKEPSNITNSDSNKENYFFDEYDKLFEPSNKI